MPAVSGEIAVHTRKNREGGHEVTRSTARVSGEG